MPSGAGLLARSRAVLLKDAEDVLGPAALVEVTQASSALLARSSQSLPQMIQQPDGSWKAPPPSIAAAVRTGSGWVRIGAAGARHPFESAAAMQLERLIDNPLFWSEPATKETPCTDPSGMMLLALRDGREFFGRYPCGFTGLTGLAAQLVLAGKIQDWSKIDADLRPAGVPIARFDEAIQSQFRFTSGIPDERLIEIRSEASWDAHWRRMMMPLGKLPRLPAVDFRREMLLLAAMGRRPSGGYSIIIDKVIDQHNELLAFVRVTSPRPRCGTTAAITSPVDIVRVPASEKTVRFVVERQIAECR